MHSKTFENGTESIRERLGRAQARVGAVMATATGLMGSGRPYPPYAARALIAAAPTAASVAAPAITRRGGGLKAPTRAPMLTQGPSMAVAGRPLKAPTYSKSRPSPEGSPIAQRRASRAIWRSI